MPLSRNILHNPRVMPWGNTGQRMNPTERLSPKDYRGWLVQYTNSKVEISNLNYLISIRDSAKSGLGFGDNRHLNYLVESINMNVGDSYQNAKASSQPMAGKRVGAVIVVGGWENQPQGEGRQSVGKPAKLTE
jgi:hypothetical protein